MVCSGIILNYNDTKRCVDLAIKLTKFANINHVIIVDNCSKKEEREELIKLKNNKTKIIFSEFNGGYSYGYNLGIKYSIDVYQSDYIFMINTDVILEENIINKCIFYHNKFPKLGLVSTRMKNIKNEEKVSAWHFPTYKQYILFCYFFMRSKGTNIGYEFQENGCQIVDVVSGCFMCFKAEAIVKANFYDENVFLYNEEVIMGKRLRKAGYKTGIIVTEFYTHDHKDSQSRPNYKQVLSTFMSGYYYMTNYNGITKPRKYFYKISCYIATANLFSRKYIKWKFNL